LVASASSLVPPALAVDLFAERLPLALRYAEWFAGAGVERGLVGPREVDRVWQRHILNCVAVGALIEPGSLVVDLGAGAGLPGIVLAIARPDLRVVLVESMLRRTAFLEEVIADLALRSVSVRRARAEDLAKEKLRADVVTARAVAPIDRLATWAVPLLREGGALLALKGTGIIDEMATGWATLRSQGLAQHGQLFAVVAQEGWPSRGPRGSQPGLVAVEQGHWDDSSSGAMFLPREGAQVPEDDRLALVVRLCRSGKRLSPDRGSGLG
jgi:16S rRNA (guanine527-N7)-methyltransferase